MVRISIARARRFPSSLSETHVLPFARYRAVDVGGEFPDESAVSGLAIERDHPDAPPGLGRRR